MNSWIMVMWIISSLMACWSFSLFIRLISEIVAQNQNQMVAKKSTRSLWIGFVLIFICGATSVFAARAAIHVENTFGGGLTRWSTPIALVCGTAGLFGICMFIWAWVGDRPRGRTRCPKCWYDMSAATGLLCPECGRTAKSTKKFSKTRRPKWAFVVALFFFIVGGYGFSVSKRVAENDWLAAVPSWFLMLGWEHLPEDWIFEDNSPYFSTLDTRFDDSWRDYAWISDSRSRRFGRKLCRGFLDSKEARWDPGRVLLLDAIGQERILYKNANDDDKRKWTGPPIDSTELLQRSTDYLIDAVLKNNPSTLELQNIDNTFNTYTIAKEWIQETLDQQDENQTDYDDESYWQNWELNRLNFQSHLSKQFSQKQRDRIVADQFKKMFVSTDMIRQHVTTTLVYDMHMLEHFFDVLLDPKPDSNKISPHRRSIYLGILSDTFSPNELNRLFDELNTLLDNDGDENVALVLSTLGS
ncbi:MAG: hypothetical protein P1U42_07780, partial [Phycisphaerales bacterium]|nr:hypothetical protein [Phycisphaerales bacterium]